MKSIILAFAISILATGCYREQPEKSSVSKKVIAKESPVEQRMAYDFFSKESLRQRSTTIYYLIADDGTVAEVGLSDYSMTQVGSSYSTDTWTRK